MLFLLLFVIIFLHRFIMFCKAERTFRVCHIGKTALSEVRFPDDYLCLIIVKIDVDDGRSFGKSCKLGGFLSVVTTEDCVITVFFPNR